MDAIAETRVVRVPARWREEVQFGTEENLAVVGVGPTGVGELDPLVTATADGRTAFYPGSDPEAAADVAAALADGRFVEGDRAVVEHDPDQSTRPTLDGSSADVGSRLVTAGWGWRRPADPADHRRAGGFVETEASTLFETVEGIRGRGWGDWHHDRTVVNDWQALRSADRETAVVVNAHGTAADRLLLESAPFEALEGAQLAASAVGAETVYVYVSAADETAVSRTREAADAYPDPTADLVVVTGPDAYRAGEPTMALEAIEGSDRLEARLRTPAEPAPTLDGDPALVHTARTLAQVAVAARNGELPGTRLLTVSGDVEAASTIELSESESLHAALDAVEFDGELRAACVGGRFGGLTTDLDVAVDPDALAAADLGTEGTIEVLDERRCVLSFVGKRAKFASKANCGRCVPCREGTTQLTELLRDVYDGDYDPAAIAELVRVMDRSSVCEFGVAAGRPARTAMDGFESELRAHASGTCPAGTCFDAAEVSN